MTTQTAKMAMPGAPQAFVFAAAILPGAAHIGAHAWMDRANSGDADRAISIEAEAVRGQARVRQPRSRGKVVS